MKLKWILKFERKIQSPHCHFTDSAWILYKQYNSCPQTDNDNLLSYLKNLYHAYTRLAVNYFKYFSFIILFSHLFNITLGKCRSLCAKCNFHLWMDSLGTRYISSNNLYSEMPTVNPYSLRHKAWIKIK